MQKRLVVLLATMAMLTACGSGSAVKLGVTTTAAQGPVARTPGAGTDCRTSQDRAGTPNASAQDTPTAGEAGGTTEGTDPLYDTHGVWQWASAIGEFRVVGRDVAHQRSNGASMDGEVVGNPAPGAAAPSAPPGLAVVSRALRLQTLKALKGNLPDCVAIDIPGGSAGGVGFSAGTGYPSVVPIGMTLLVLFSQYPSGYFWPAAVTPVNGNGTATLPFESCQTYNADHTCAQTAPVTVNINTWQG